MTSLRIVVLGLSLSSSWGNGHATTYRALLRGLAVAGHDVLFLERDVPWYAAHRDLPAPDFCRFALYDDLTGLRRRHGAAIAAADAVIVGSYVPDGVAVLDFVLTTAAGVRAFYDIDTPITIAALRLGDAAYLARRQIAQLGLYLSFSGGPVLRQLERDYGAARARALYCSVDAVQYRPHGGAQDWAMGYLGTYSPDRQPAVERLLIEPARLLPDLRFVVAGPQYPQGLDWPANVDRIAHLPPPEHAAFYGRQHFTLNVTRADMVEVGWSPSVRLFEAAACGTPIISDRWDGLTELLPEETAILIVSETQDVVRLLRDCSEARRTRVAEAARDVVLRAHTGTARARQLLGYLWEAACSATA